MTDTPTSHDATSNATSSDTTAKTGRGLVMAAMIFAVGMTFIDQTIVAIAVARDPT